MRKEPFREGAPIDRGITSGFREEEGDVVDTKLKSDLACPITISSEEAPRMTLLEPFGIVRTRFLMRLTLLIGKNLRIWAFVH